jgi:D-amino-acid oxidase
MEDPMHRRAFLKKGGVAALGLAMGGCAPVLAGQRTPRRPSAMLYPVDVSWDRVIRTTVGLRPHRPSGFVVRAERLDDRTLIHNFGHGGAGMSLSWGTATLAAELAMPHPERRAAVLGCGVVGLTTARLLQRRGFDVTIYAASLPPETTSNMLWGGFTPTSGLVTLRTPEWDAQFRRAAEIAYREHQLLVGRGYGVSWIATYTPTDSRTITPRGEAAGGVPAEPLLPTGLTSGSAILGPGEHPFLTRYARASATMRFEPSIYLEKLMHEVVEFGGRIVVRRFDTPRDLMLLDEKVIVNCTGLGAKTLFGDQELTPLKGQLTVLIPQPEINYSMGGMMPRSDGIVLGHVTIRDDWSLEVNQTERTRVVENAMRSLARIRPPRAGAPPMRVSMDTGSPPPLEHFFGLES